VKAFKERTINFALKVQRKDCVLINEQETTYWNDSEESLPYAYVPFKVKSCHLPLSMRKDYKNWKLLFSEDSITLVEDAFELFKDEDCK
jgi:hypothetical protein